MNKQSVWIAGVIGMFVLGMIASSNIVTAVLEEASEKQTVPRYSEDCAHGHNGFDCKPPKYRMDVSELQERTDDLEERVIQLERSR